MLILNRGNLSDCVNIFVHVVFVTTNYGLNSGIDGRDTSSGTQFRGARIFARVRPALFAAADLPQALRGHIWDL